MAATPKVTGVQALEPYVLEVSFEDGESRRVDIAPLLFGEMFEPLRDHAVFRTATFDAELGTVVWPNGADLSPEFLYAGEGTPSTPRVRK